MDRAISVILTMGQTPHRPTRSPTTQAYTYYNVVVIRELEKWGSVVSTVPPFYPPSWPPSVSPRETRMAASIHQSQCL